MKKSGITNLPLHTGEAPRWLFNRMIKLAGVITDMIVEEYGRDEFLRRIADPFWFQAFSCTLGFDWHSSGTTTTTCGALKSAIKPDDHGIYIAGGKGIASRKTPIEIKKIGDRFDLTEDEIQNLIYSSKIAAKVDNSCIQDGYQLYHHMFIFTEDAKWAVIQQGMNTKNKYARRYQWLSEDVNDFVNEPHTGVSCDRTEEDVLNMVAKESFEARKISVDLVKDNPVHIKKYLSCTEQKTLNDAWEYTMPSHHPVLRIDLSEKDMEILKKAYELQPKNYEELISLDGMGPKKIRALALISDLVYGAHPSWNDPVKYSFTHGGKDGYPYPVNRKVYDHSIKTLEEALEGARIGDKEKYEAIRRLHEFIGLSNTGD